MGGPTINWDHTWTDTQLNNTNFRLRVESIICLTACVSFPKGSLLLDDQGKYREIESFKSGDIVLSYNNTDKKFEKNHIVSLTTHPANEIYVINKTLRVTGNELIYAAVNDQNYKWMPISELRIGNQVMWEDGQRNVFNKTIDSIDIIHGNTEVYSIETAKPFNNYWVNQYLLDPPFKAQLDQVQVRVYYTAAVPEYLWFLFGGAPVIPYIIKIRTTRKNKSKTK